MGPIAAQMEIEGLPPYIASWSAARIPGFIPAVLNRWWRNQGELPRRFSMVICPQVEVDENGGLPARVMELTNPRLRFLHFTGCHKPYVVLLYTGNNTEAWRAEVQQFLAWSESYQAKLMTGMTHLKFIDAVEERPGDFAIRQGIITDVTNPAVDFHA